MASRPSSPLGPPALDARTFPVHAAGAVATLAQNRDIDSGGTRIDDRELELESGSPLSGKDNLLEPVRADAHVHVHVPTSALASTCASTGGAEEGDLKPEAAAAAAVTAATASTDREADREPESDRADVDADRDKLRREREEAGSTGPDSARNVDVCTDQEGTRGPARGDVDGMRTDKSSPAAQSLSGAAELSAKFGCKQPVVFLLGGAKPSSAYVGCCCNLKRKFAELRGSGLLDMTRDRGPWKIRAVAHGFPNENVAKAFQMLLESKCRSSGVSKKLRVMRELTEDFSAISGEPRAGDAGAIRVEVDADGDAHALRVGE
eukprot:tig00000743_g3853.t1